MAAYTSKILNHISHTCTIIYMLAQCIGYNLFSMSTLLKSSQSMPKIFIKTLIKIEKNTKYFISFYWKVNVSVQKNGMKKLITWRPGPLRKSDQII